MANKMANSLRDYISNGGAVVLPGMARNASSRLQELVKTANHNHPEVNEIDPSDLIIGVKFEGNDYPPEMEDEDEDE